MCDAVPCCESFAPEHSYEACEGVRTMPQCTGCLNQVGDDSAFCHVCGRGVHAGPAGARRLNRLPNQGTVAGVCAGIADYFAIDVTLVRLLWVSLTIVPGAIVGGLIAYVAAWVLMPVVDTPAGAPPLRRLFRSETDRKIAGVCGGVAAYLNVDATLVRIAFVILSVYPGALIGGLIAYVLAWSIVPLEPPAHLHPATA